MLETPTIIEERSGKVIRRFDLSPLAASDEALAANDEARDVDTD